MTFIQNLGWRYATKKFDGRKVEAEKVEKILESIRMAPTSLGLQPFHVTIVENNDALKAELRAHAWDQAQLTTNSHLLVFSANIDIKARAEEYIKLAGLPDDHEYAKMIRGFVQGADAEWSAKQAYIALGFAMAACAEFQVDSCPMEGFDPVFFKTALGLAENLSPKVLLPIGYRASDDTQHPKVRFSADDMFTTK